MTRAERDAIDEWVETPHGMVYFKTLEKFSMTPDEFGQLEGKQKYALRQHTRRELEEQAKEQRKYQ